MAARPVVRGIFLRSEPRDPKAALNQQTGALYTVQAPTIVKRPEVGVFHESRIVVMADHVEHWLDGEKVLSYPLTGAPEAT